MVVVLILTLKPADRIRWIALDLLSPTTFGTRGSGLAIMSVTLDPGCTLLPGLMSCLKTVPGCRPDGCFSMRPTFSPALVMAARASARLRPTTLGMVSSSGLGVGVGTGLGLCVGTGLGVGVNTGPGVGERVCAWLETRASVGAGVS